MRFYIIELEGKRADLTYCFICLPTLGCLLRVTQHSISKILSCFSKPFHSTRVAVNTYIIHNNLFVNVRLVDEKKYVVEMLWLF